MSSTLNGLEFPTSFPAPQGKDSLTFHPPPVDGTRSVPELFQYNAEHSPEHPLFVFADRPDATRTIKYSEAWRMIQRASKIVHGNVTKYQERHSVPVGADSTTSRTVGILANADYISYFCTILAIMRLGLTPFPLSIRNSPIAIAHLIKKTQIQQLFVSSDPAMQRLCKDSLAILKQDGIDIEVMPMIQFDAISDESAQAAELDTVVLQVPKIDMNTLAIILHSSGTTSFPKPISVTHPSFLQWTLLPLYGETDLCGSIMAVHTCPMFHMMGVATITLCVVPGLVMGCFKPSSPPTLPTPDIYLSNIIQTKSEIVFCVPSFIEAWAKDLTKLASIKSLKSIAFAGAPITKSVGDQIVGMGIKLYPFYGLTECCSICRLFPASVPTVDTWEWFEFSPHIKYELIPQEDRDDIFEICILSTPRNTTCAVNATSKEGIPMYRTFDLLQKHPKYPNKWRVHGRADDQIMLATGEKTNPGPLEAILVQDPHVSHAIMFGRGQIQNGVLVDPKKDFAFDPSDEAKLIDFRNKIWPSVEKMNEFAPAHSRLFKEMIIVSSPSKPFDFTSKGTPRRHAIINNYDPEIQALYAVVKDSSQADIPAPQKWDESSVQDFIREVVHKVMEIDLSDDTDFFQQGCDSLQTTYIRNAINHAIRQAPGSERIRLPNNFVYANPTISSLASFILSLFSSDGQGSGDKSERDAKAMEVMVEKYSADFPVHTARGAAPAESLDEIVFVSGTSGRLGAHLLAQLLARSNVKKVYAANRPANENIRERQRKTFESWGLDTGLLESGKVVLVEADFAKADLGIGEALYNEIRDSVTSIIHNAWRVDFNVAVSSFEPLVAGMRNLIDLSLASPRPSPPPILFTSSISVIMKYPTYPIPEEPITETKIATVSGYSESKWVSETLLLRAREKRGLRINVVRVGQLCGDLKTGGWNKQEWVPVMLRGSQVLGAVPRRVEIVSFIAVDTAASTILDMLGSAEPVLHLVHPNPVPWTVISETASKVLNVPIIPYNEWLSRLQDAARSALNDSDAPKHNPALKLLDFYEKDLPEESPFDVGTTKAVKVSRTLKEAKQMDGEDVERWITYWRKVGLLQ